MAKSIKYNNVPVMDVSIWKRIQKAIPELGEVETVAGVLAERYGNEPVEGAPDLTYAQLMTIQEYGNRHIPARPVVGPIMDSATTHNTVSKMVTAAVKDVVKSAITGSKRIRAGEKLMTSIGQYLVDQMKARIRAGIAPALAERTLQARRRAGRDGTTPLLDTRHLINSFSHAVRPIGGGK